MSLLSAQSTLDILQRLYRHVAPVLPPKLDQEVVTAIEKLQKKRTLKRDAAEEVLLRLGKKVWPYRKAFEEFLRSYESHMGDQFLRAHISRPLKKRYDQFVAHGGGLRELQCGRPASFFTSEERVELCEVLVQMKMTLRKFVVQVIKSTEKKRFDDKVASFSGILADIESNLAELHAMAEEHSDHPEFQAEMRAHIEGFEQGICLLGPEVDVAAVCSATEHFAGRKHEMRVRGRSLSLGGHR